MRYSIDFAVLNVLSKLYTFSLKNASTSFYATKYLPATSKYFVGFSDK